HWLQTALVNLPPDACGVFLGEIPAGWRKYLTRALHLRGCPRTFVVHLRRHNDGVALTVNLYTDKAGADVILLDDLETWRRRCLGVLQASYPALGLEPEALAQLGRALNAWQWKTTPGSGKVSISASMSGRTGKALVKLVKRLD